jgi:hypothetical protein
MKFTYVALTFGPYDSFVIPLKQYARKESIVVKGIDGLDPPPVTVTVSKSINDDSTIQGINAEDRELTILFGLQPNYKDGETYASLRARLYGLLTPKFNYPVGFQLLDADKNVVATAEGSLKSLSAGIFSQVTDVQIVMTCNSPYLDAPRFYLPDPALQSLNPLIFENPGNAPCGFNLQFTLGDIAPHNELTISKASFGEILSFNPAFTFKKDDVINIRTETNKKTATCRSRGKAAKGDYANYTTKNLLAAKSTASTWFGLHAGTNNLLVAVDGIYIDKFVVDYLAWTPRYWGI